MPKFDNSATGGLTQSGNFLLLFLVRGKIANANNVIDNLSHLKGLEIDQGLFDSRGR